MVDAYLRWKYGFDIEVTPAQPPQPSPIPSTPTFTNDVSTHTSLPQPPDNPNSYVRDSPPPGKDLELVAIDIDIYTLSKSVKIRVSSGGTDTTASVLAAQGFIGNASFKPSVAVSIKTLELYRILCWQKPSFSIEAFVKVISDLYLISTYCITTSCRINQKNRSLTVLSTAMSFQTRLMSI